MVSIKTNTKAVLTIAHMILPGVRKEMEDEQREYLEMVKDCRKRGFSPEYCRHGVNLWINDWDCACGLCEMGEEPTAIEKALYKARKALNESTKARDALLPALVFLNQQRDFKLYDALSAYIGKSVDDLLKRYTY